MKEEENPIGMHRTNVLVSYHLKELKEKHNLNYSEAVRVGLSLMLAEKGVKDYDNNLNIMRKIDKIRQVLEEKSQELAEIKEKKLHL